MKNYLSRHRDDDPIEELSEVIRDLTVVLAHGSVQVTKQDLANLENNIMAKLSQIKADVAKVNTQLAEGLAEITARLDQLVADAQDPEVSEPEFLTNLEAVKATAEALANIANPPTSSEPPPAPVTT